MANTVKLKRSSVEGKVPTTTDLETGEMGLNTFDGKAYIKKDNGTESIVLLNPTLANVATSGSYTDLSDKPTIPSDLFDLGITDGTSGQVLTTDGNGVVSFTTVTGGSATPGGSDTQLQYNNGGAFAGLSTLTTDGANVTIGNTTITSSQNRIDRTDQNWNTGTTGALGTIRFGNGTDNTYDPFSNLRNSKIRVEQILDTTNGMTTGLRRVALSSSAVLKNATGNLSFGSNDRMTGVRGEATLDNGTYTNTGGSAFSLTGGSFSTLVRNGTTPYATGTVSSVIVESGGTVAGAIGSVSGFVVQNTGSVLAAANYVAQWLYSGTAPTTATSNSYAYYVGAPAGTSDTIIGVNGSPNPSYQTGVPYSLYVNNDRVMARVGSIAQADEVINATTHSSEGTLALSVKDYMTHEVTLGANITELTLTTYNTNTSVKPRMANATLIFKQDATGGRTVTWPTGTKFAGGVTDIGITANEVTFVSILVYSGVQYVTIATYS